MKPMASIIDTKDGYFLISLTGNIRSLSIALSVPVRQGIVRMARVIFPKFNHINFVNLFTMKGSKYHLDIEIDRLTN